MKRFDEIIAVLLLARAGSYRSATRESGLSFKTLSKRVATLEAELGFPIFHTTNNGLKVTNEGKAVIAEAERIEDGLNRLRLMAQRSLPKTVSEFVISASAATISYWLMPRMAEFQAVNPQISLRFQSYGPTLVAVPHEGDISLHLHEPLEGELVRQRLARLHMVLCGSSDYLSLHGNPSTPAELSSHAFVEMRPGWYGQNEVVERYLGGSQPPNQNMLISDPGIFLLMLKRGAGLGMMPTYILAADSELCATDVDILISHDIWISYARDARQNPRLSLTIDWLIGLFEPKLNPWFRRSFVHPREFPDLIEKLGIGETIAKHRFRSPG